MPIVFEPRDAPCTGCGALVALKVIKDSNRLRAHLGDRRLPIHEFDGTPADELCRRQLPGDQAAPAGPRTASTRRARAPN